MVKVKEIVTAPHAVKDAEKLNHSDIAGGNGKWASHYEKQLLVVIKLTIHLP